MEPEGMEHGICCRRPLQLQGSGFRKAENKLCSDAFRADHVDIFAVRLDDLPDNGQTKAGSTLVFSAGQIGFIEAVPYFFQAFPGNADPCIFHRYENFFISE